MADFEIAERAIFHFAALQLHVTVRASARYFSAFAF
jgi:hypothetical protein